eukprot:1160277-Pelagomonas_calceolata.AAC.21
MESAVQSAPKEQTTAQAALQKASTTHSPSNTSTLRKQSLPKQHFRGEAQPKPKQQNQTQGAKHS